MKRKVPITTGEKKYLLEKRKEGNYKNSGEFFEKEIFDIEFPPNKDDQVVSQQFELSEKTTESLNDYAQEHGLSFENAMYSMIARYIRKEGSPI